VLDFDFGFIILLTFFISSVPRFPIEFSTFDLKHLSKIIVSFFQQKKPKRFNYIPRNERDDDDKVTNGLKSRWDAVRGTGKHRSKSRALPILLIILGMIIAIWYLLTHYETI